MKDNAAESHNEPCEGWDALRSRAHDPVIFDSFEKLIFGDAARESFAGTAAALAGKSDDAITHAANANIDMLRALGGKSVREYIADIRPTIEHAMEERVSSPANKAISNALAHHWLSLEILDEVPDLDAKKSYVTRSEEWRRHEKLHYTPQGKLIFDLLYECCVPIIMSHARRAARHFQLDIAVFLEGETQGPYEYFKNTLYRFKADGGGNFFYYLDQRLKFYFREMAIKEIKRKNLPIASLDKSRGKSSDEQDFTLLHALSDKDAVDAHDQVVQDEERGKLHRAIGKIPDPHIKQVIQMRIGAAPYEKPSSFIEIGDAMSISKHGAMDLYEQGIHNLMVIAAHDDEAPEPDLSGRLQDVLDMKAEGRDRAYAAAYFFRQLRNEHKLHDNKALARDIAKLAANRVLPNTIYQAMKHIAVPDEQLDWDSRPSLYNALRYSIDQNPARAIAEYAFPDKPELQARCMEFFCRQKKRER